MAKAKPVRELEALVKVFEVNDQSMGIRLSFGHFELPGGGRCEVYSTFARDVVCLAREGHLTRVVKVQDLVASILSAKED